jgi:hypothetical protein
VPANDQVEVRAKKYTPPEIPSDCHDYKLLQDIEDARAKWRGFGITDYSYTAKRLAFVRLLGWPTDSGLVVRVRNGVVSVGPTKLPDSMLQSLSVEGQFEDLEKTVLEEPDCLRATFDETFGFTTSMYVDPDWETTDDEITLTFTDFGT